MTFISEFNILGLAIGLMIGGNLKDVAGDFIDDILMPFVNPILEQIINAKEGWFYLFQEHLLNFI